MRKFIFLFTFLLLSIFNISTSNAAESSFKETAHVTYELLEDSSIKATYDIQITNLKTEVYAPNISLSLEGFTPTRIEAFEGGIAASIKNNENNSYEVTFKKPAVGKGVTKRIVFTFYDNNIVEANEQVTRIHIPKASNLEQFSSFNVDLKIPLKVSQNPTISPEPLTVNEKNGYKIYSFSLKNVANAINADFGEYQDYSYSISYLPESFQNENGLFTIPIPPDTSYQKVLINEFSLKPDDISPDIDGNWIAKYSNRPVKTVKVSGKVRLFETPQLGNKSLTEEQKKLFLKGQPYWEVDDQYIKQYAKNLKTPHDIYNFVVTTLSYNFGKTNRGIARMGAAAALKNPKEAICMEFTDLFIALSRAINIPAREVNGYAYTVNPTLQPLSLVSDILHSWPEYWDGDKKTWISVDPTWGNTTNGIDYFGKFDTNHFALIIKGANSSTPITPGTISNSSDRKLIEVNPDPGFPENLLYNIIPRVAGIPLINEKLSLEIENTGNVSIPEETLTVTSKEGKIKKIVTPLVPPFSKANVKTNEKGEVIVQFREKSLRLTTPPTRIVFNIFIITVCVLLILGIIGVIKYLYEHNKLSRRS